MASVEYRWIRKRQGLWIPTRKRTYLYWFKFLQEAELSEKYQVKWNRYKGWGGSNTVLGIKFDHWWEDRWRTLFATKDRTQDRSLMKFPISTTKHKPEAIRISLLVWQARNTPPDMTPHIAMIKVEDGSPSRKASPRRGGRTLAIARKVIQMEKGKPRNTALWSINPESYGGHTDDQVVQSRIGRYMRNARKILSNVCEGRFP